MHDLKIWVFATILFLLCMVLSGFSYYQWIEISEANQTIAILKDQAIAKERELTYYKAKTAMTNQRKTRETPTPEKPTPRINQPAQQSPRNATRAINNSEEELKHRTCVSLKKQMAQLNKTSVYYKKLQSQFYDLNCVIRHNDYFTH